ncbi:MAG: hypothetical protein C3F12_09670 [Candidatus Methylomirabilota bacterium]|nr:hypothetical protein [candidate division NC10 bacterium]PWB46300.1 MAG: hypothetical protein C3F12_09670 [candidate division NC10 bacterium]
MRTTCHNRLFLTRPAQVTLISFLAWNLAAVIPPSARAAEPTLGLATGLQDAQVAIDGRQWTTLPASSSPIYGGTMLRSGKGTASLLLKDGTQLELRPQTLIGLAGSRTAPVVKIAVGQVLFRIPNSSGSVFITPSVRYQTEPGSAGNRPAVLKANSTTLSTSDSVGTIVVNARGGSRLSLEQGGMLARSANDPGIHVVKAGQSVYIPQVGAPDHDFGVLLAQAIPGDAADETGSTGTDTGNTETEEAPVVETGSGTRAETVTGVLVGLGAIGLGVGLGVSESGNNGKASPSTP